MKFQFNKDTENLIQMFHAVDIGDQNGFYYHIPGWFRKVDIKELEIFDIDNKDNIYEFISYNQLPKRIKDLIKQDYIEGLKEIFNETENNS